MQDKLNRRVEAGKPDKAFSVMQARDDGLVWSGGSSVDNEMWSDSHILKA